MILGNLTQQNILYSGQLLIQQVLGDFFRRHELTYFQYGQLFENGAMVILTNRLDFASAYHQAKLPTQSYLANEKDSRLQYFFFWEEHLMPNSIQLAHQFNMHKGICFVERFIDSYHLVAFASDKQHKNAYEDYLNHLHEFKRMIRLFEEKAKNLLLLAKSHAYYLPTWFNDPLKDQMILSGKRFALSYQGIEAKISGREYDCLRGLVQGKSLRELSEGMELSSRTVETYLQRLKARFGLEKNYHLLQLAYNNQITF